MDSFLRTIHQALGIGAEHLAACRLRQHVQPALTDLEVVDIDFEGRPFILHRLAAEAWRQMRTAADSEGIALRPFSGFRSYIRQQQLIRKKLEAGKSLSNILTETAIPGFSEHHSGCAIDICTPEKFELRETFENTGAFAWLQRNAARFGFSLSYPRNNNLGIVYEPWHWYFDRGPPGNP